jgi:ribosome biogenesis GTPase
LQRVGLVVQHGANRTWVLEDGPPGESAAQRSAREWACTLRGKLRQGRRDIVRAAVIGDRVRFRVGDAAKRQGVIDEILPRRNQISRPQPSGGARRVLQQVVVANLDRLWAIASLAQPPLNLRFVDRILAAARFQGVPASIVLNKCDLPDAVDAAPIRALYEGLGCHVCVCSARDGSGVQALRSELSGRICAFVGLSGVGKSSLLRALQPDLDLRVGEVGERHGHGRHTTASSRLYFLEGGGYLADTPGMREFGLWGVYQRDLWRCFVEIEALAERCRFRDCLHGAEPGCAVLAGVAAGSVDAGRYASYRALLEELPFDELDRTGILKGPRR